ncbi:MAG TPA: DUF4062 domain-containing protein, partial [bacterium]
MEKPLCRIFVSSTYIDLVDYRKTAELAINDLGQKYEGMEYMGAMTEEPKVACFEMVEQCDLFVGIYAWRYGHIPDGDSISITEQEYNHANGSGKPCLCYCVNEDVPWKRKFIETGAAEKKLKRFIQNLSREHVRDDFKDPDDLKYKLSRNIGKWLFSNKPQLLRDSSTPVAHPEKEYRKAIAEQYATLTMLGFKRSFDMDGIYIPLTMHLDQDCHFARQPKEADETLLSRSLKAEDLLKLTNKVAVVLGEPGMGKTTMLHYLARRESKTPTGLLPIFLKLADFCKSRQSLELFLLGSVSNYITGDAMQNLARTALQNGRALILLDGLDEVNREEYTAVSERIRAFIASHSNCRVIVTSR